MVFSVQVKQENNFHFLTFLTVHSLCVMVSLAEGQNQAQSANPQTLPIAPTWIFHHSEVYSVCSDMLEFPWHSWSCNSWRQAGKSHCQYNLAPKMQPSSLAHPQNQCHNSERDHNQPSWEFESYKFCDFWEFKSYKFGDLDARKKSILMEHVNKNRVISFPAAKRTFGTAASPSKSILLPASGEYTLRLTRTNVPQLAILSKHLQVSFTLLKHHHLRVPLDSEEIWQWFWK